MVYMGSKNRIAKDLIEIMEPYFSVDKMYYEPFVGGGNIIDKIPKDKVKGLVGNDFNHYLIALLQKMQSDDEIPFEFIEKEYWYEHISKPYKRGELNLPDWEVGYLGFTKTYSGMFMNQYSGKRPNRPQSCYQKEKHNNLMKQRPALKGIGFTQGSFLDLDIENGSIVYLDPPYRGTAKYKDAIDYDVFYGWVDDLVKNKNCIVFMSEYTAPADLFTCIWEKSISNLANKQAIEKLFIYNS